MRSVKRIVAEGNLMKNQGNPVIFKSTQKNRARKKKIVIDNFDVGVIRRKITEFYTVRKQLPTVNKLNNLLKEDNIVDCSREYLRKFLHKMGYKFLKRQSKRFLIERPEISALRWHYLKKMKQYRNEGRSIIFLDETYVNQCHAVNKCWQSNLKQGCLANTGKGPHLIVVHAGGRNGFVKGALLIFKSKTETGDYHGGMDSDKFQKWMRQQLLPNLPSNSVIVLDNASYHSVQIDKKLTMATTKPLLQDWLKRNNVNFQDNDRKADLIQLINQHSFNEKCKIDELLKESGHDVLRLPPYHPDLNPIELVWGDVKEQLAREHVDSTLTQKEKLLETLFSNYTTDKWQKCDDDVMKIEDQYYNNDKMFDDAVDNMTIGAIDSDESSSSEYDYDSM